MNEKVTKTDVMMADDKIILMSVYDKADIVYYILPCRDKRGHYPPCVKQVNSLGDMILSDDERNAFSKGEVAFIKETDIFEVKSGKVYNLNDIWDKAEWEAIKNSPFIAQSRDAKDKDGNLIIDGPVSTTNKASRNGVAELYIYKPGIETQRRVSVKQLVHNAESYIFNDERGAEGHLYMARLLGRDMSNQPLADVTDFLLQEAKKDPKKIINLYTGGDTSIRLLFVEAKEKKVIYVKNKVYYYGDNIALGATDEAVIAWMKEARNKNILKLIKLDTFPDYQEIEE